MQELQKQFHEGLREAMEERASVSNSLHAAGSEAVVTLLDELRGLEKRTASTNSSSQFSEHCDRLREGLEKQRQARRETTESTTRAISVRLHRVRDQINAEEANLGRLYENLTSRWAREAELLQSQLQDEKEERQTRHVALSEVVQHMKTSLESTLVGADLTHLSLSSPETISSSVGAAALLAQRKSAAVVRPSYSPPADKQRTSELRLSSQARRRGMESAFSGPPARQSSLPAPPSLPVARATTSFLHANTPTPESQLPDHADEASQRSGPPRSIVSDTSAETSSLRDVMHQRFGSHASKRLSGRQ